MVKIAIPKVVIQWVIFQTCALSCCLPAVKFACRCSSAAYHCEQYHWLWSTTKKSFDAMQSTTCQCRNTPYVFILQYPTNWLNQANTSRETDPPDRLTISVIISKYRTFREIWILTNSHHFSCSQLNKPSQPSSFSMIYVNILLTYRCKLYFFFKFSF